MTLPQVTLEKPRAAGDSTADVQVWEKPGEGPNPSQLSGRRGAGCTGSKHGSGPRGLAPSPLGTCLAVGPA